MTLYGAGLIGSGWATHLMCCDFPNVTLYDIREEALDQARRRIQHDLEFLVGESVLKEEQALERMGRLRFTCDQREALADADLIQENCPENLELKQTVVAAIEMSCRPDTIIASSTSGISATLIAKNMNHPERLMGAHPYHPVYLLPLVELVKGEKTNPECLKALVQFYRSIRKEPVVLHKECPGYIASRLMSVLFRESTYLIQSGVATMEDIYTAFTYGPGMRYGLIGINMTLQLAGGDQGLAAPCLAVLVLQAAIGWRALLILPNGRRIIFPFGRPANDRWTVKWHTETIYTVKTTQRLNGFGIGGWLNYFVTTGGCEKRENMLIRY